VAPPVEVAGAPTLTPPSTGEAEPAPRSLSRRIALTVLAVLSVQFAALCLHQAWNDAPTFDETVYMSSGLATLYEGELRVNNEAPFMTKALHALPLRLTGVDVPLDGYWTESHPIDGRSSYFAYGLAGEFNDLHAQRGDLQRVVFIGRLVAVIEGVAIGAALYALSATLFSRGAGLLAAGAWLTTPLAVGFGHLNSLDLAFTLAVVAAALALVRHLRAPTWRTLTVLALAAGALQLARHTGFLYVGVMCVALIVRRRRHGWDAARDVAVVLVATWASVWIATFLVAPTRVPIDRASVDDMLADQRAQDQGAMGDVLSVAVDLVPWPAEYELGFQIQLATSSGDTVGYLLGETWQGARPTFWPLAMLVKLPVTVVAVLLVGPLAWRWLSDDQRRLAALVAGLSALASFAFVLPYTKPVGLRYALPGIAMLLVVASPLALGLRRHRAGYAILGVGVIAQLAFLWGSVPHSFAWTAPPFRPGYQVVSESNLDWGQDGYRLAAWLEGRVAHVAYFGTNAVVDQLPGYRSLLGTSPDEITGWVAVSASFLTAHNRHELAWLRAYCNVGTIGGTILLYHFDQPPTTEPGPDEPTGRCSGSTSRRV
jgi:Dolichyl-phosphate-mannose-protein mannosyltransferase